MSKFIREFRSEDFAELQRIHAAQGFDYALPDLSNPLFVTKLVLLDGERDRPAAAESREGREVPSLRGARARNCSGADADEHRGDSSGESANKNNCGETKILGAVFLRLTAEAYLLLDPAAGSARTRWNSLLSLHAAAERDAWQRGLEDVHAWLPPPIAANFGKHIERLGWIRDAAWTPYCKKLNGGF